MIYFCVRCGRRLYLKMPAIGRRDARIAGWLGRVAVPKRCMCSSCIDRIDDLDDRL